MTPAGLPSAKKSSPLLWVLAAVAGILVLIGIALLVGGLFLAQRARQAGFDPDTIGRNPGAALARLVTMMNPNTDVVSVDDAKGTVTVRDRKTGKIITLRFDDLRKGKISINSEDGGSVTVNSGEEARVPRWLPSYPGAKATANVSVQAENGDAGTVVLTTPDDPSRVFQFYSGAFRDRGPRWHVRTTATDDGGVLTALNEETQRQATIAVAKTADGSTINITFSRK